VRALAAAAVALAAQAGAAAGADAPERLVVANSASWMPYAFRDADGEPRGVLVDLWRRVGERTDVEIAFELVTWRRSLDAVTAGAVDVHGGLTRSRRRAEILDFSAPIIRVETQLFARRGEGVLGLADAVGRSVGVVDGTVEQAFLARYWSGIETVPYADSEAMVMAAVGGAVDAFVTDFPTGQYRLIRREAIDRFATVDTLYTEGIRAAVPKGEAARLAWVDAALARIDEAEKQALLDRWLVPRAPLPPWWPWTLVGAAGGLVGVGVGVHYVALRRMVWRRTEDLRKTVAALAAANNELDRRAHVDPLTGLANRRRFVDAALAEIARVQRYGHPLALALIDVDGLKAINDRFGHLAGDAALDRIARTLADHVRAHDLVARWGGDEFAVLLVETEAAEARATASRLAAAVAATRIDVDGTAIPLGIGVGVAAYPGDGAGLDAWIAAADAALYGDKCDPGAPVGRA
jgi:diguanylate cyclase (GGDEF)-like protein